MAWTFSQSASYVPLSQDDYSSSTVDEEDLFPKQELLSKGSSQKAWFIVIILALLLGLAVAVAVVLRNQQTSNGDVTRPPMSDRLHLKQRSISLDDFIKGVYSPVRFNGTWISDEEILYRASNGSYMLYNAKKLQSKVLLPVYSKMPHEDVISNAFQYELSADRKYLMVAHGYQKLYRHSFLAFYHIIDLETKKSWPLTDVNGSQMLLQLVVWSPVGNAFAYVYVNDIYYRASAKEQQPILEHRLTHNGRPGTIYNGVPDWVHEEELLASNTAMWFSPDGHHLAFATFNDSQTPVMNIPYYGAPGDVRYQYTQAVNIRYPKPGRPNPTITVNIASLSELKYPNSNVEMFEVVNKYGMVRNPILVLVKWTPYGGLLTVRMDRMQYLCEAIHCTTKDKRCTEIFFQDIGRLGWIRFSEPYFSKNGSIMAFLYSNGESYMHVKLQDIRIPNPKDAQTLTSGRFVVSDILAWNEKSNKIYFLATEENHPGRKHLYSVNAKLDSHQKHECITCSPSFNCSYVSASFSKDNSYYVLSCAGPNVPWVAIYSKDHKRLMTWEDNKKLSTRLEGKKLPIIQYLDLPIDDNMTAYVKLFLPPGLDTSGNTKYPLLVQVYAGPDSAQVLERFGVDWYSYLTVNKSIIYAMIDGRGSGNKGDKVLYANYMNLGTKEIDDQINVTRWLQKTMPYIDAKNTAIWGWSYGGYATGMALAKDKAGVFKCGISVAPVSDWLLYDTIYTERFLGFPTPSENMKGYEAASLVNKVQNFKNKKFLLVHGTLDDNVHYQQSMMLAKSLELNDILFEQLSYPDEGHGLSNVRPHLYHSLEHFLLKCYSSASQ